MISPRSMSHVAHQNNKICYSEIWMRRLLNMLTCWLKSFITFFDFKIQISSPDGWKSCEKWTYSSPLLSIFLTYTRRRHWWWLDQVSSVSSVRKYFFLFRPDRSDLTSLWRQLHAFSLLWLNVNNPIIAFVWLERANRMPQASWRCENSDTFSTSSFVKCGENEIIYTFLNILIEYLRMHMLGRYDDGST